MRTYEDAIIQESEALVENLNKINTTLRQLNIVEMNQMVEKLRNIEKKTSLVYTFFKQSMYSAENNNNNDGSGTVEESNTNRPMF